MHCIRASQFSCLLRTSTRPPTAAMLSATKRRVSWRMASGSATTSESTETMISASVSRTARLIEHRLPLLTALRRTRTRPPYWRAACLASS